ncbi:MAG: hypothetical protein IKN72_12820 [Clostridia bacterium]|nr:hypothetical protein [Clostridia bacterium]MBR3554250.1 hypothetical protein [Clostridia bacterium]
MFDKVKEFIGIVQDYFKKIGETGFLQSLFKTLKMILHNDGRTEGEQLVDVVIDTLPEA